MSNADVDLDVTGYNCPIPLLRAKKALAGMQRGQTLRVVATDPGAEIDFKVFTEAAGHTLVSIEQTGSLWTIVLKKGEP